MFLHYRFISLLMFPRLSSKMSCWQWRCWLLCNSWLIHSVCVVHLCFTSSHSERSGQLPITDTLHLLRLTQTILRSSSLSSPEPLVKVQTLLPFLFMSHLIPFPQSKPNSDILSGAEKERPRPQGLAQPKTKRATELHSSSQGGRQRIGGGGEGGSKRGRVDEGERWAGWGKNGGGDLWRDSSTLAVIRGRLQNIFIYITNVEERISMKSGGRIKQLVWLCVEHGRLPK